MDRQSFAQRNCPACGGSTPVTEVESDPRAQEMGFEDLRPYWSGLFKDKVFFSYNRCGVCGLLFAPTYFTARQLENLYSEMAPNMEVVPVSALAATQRGYFDAVRSLALDGDYLEIGPDVGYVAREAAAQGKFEHFWLFEPNLSVHAQLAGVVAGRPNTLVSQMDDISIVPDGTVGLAVMIHVLDHLFDPKATLAAVHRKLKPGGRLLSVTHNEASLLRRLMGRRWPPFCLQHPELYSPRSMTEVLRRANFTSVAVSRSKNYFPIAFMAQQAAWRFGLDIATLPLPTVTVGLKLGNMLTVAER